MKTADDIFNTPIAELRFGLECAAAIRNTAARLGVDPVAFAEACQDGSLLANALLLSPDTATRDKYLALKRAEPET